MPYLGDYLGHLLSEITIARMHADLEAIRVAELYGTHPLLRHMPVPHFRLPNITLDVPVVITKMEEAKKGDSLRGGIVVPAIRKSFDRLLAIHLKRTGIDLSDQEKVALGQALNEVMSRVTAPPDIGISVTHLADELVFTVIRLLSDPQREGGPVEGLRLEQFAQDLKTAARAEFVQLKEAPPRLHVLVTTAELREAGPSDLLARLHLSISEEAFEWTVIESRGRSIDRLVPE